MPALQLASEILPARNSAIEDFEVYWANEADGDFVLEEKFTSLYRRFPNKLAVHFYDDAQLYSGEATLFKRNTGELREVSESSRARKRAI